MALARRVSLAVLVMLMGVWLAVLVAPVTAQGQPASQPPTPPPTPTHEWTLALGGAIIGGLFAPLGDWIDTRLGITSIGRLRAEQSKFQAEMRANLADLASKADELAVALRLIQSAPSKVRPSGTVAEATTSPDASVAGNQAPTTPS